jgi:hypothetical protein
MTLPPYVGDRSTASEATGAGRVSTPRPERPSDTAGHSFRDGLTRTPDLSTQRGTGPERTERPVYVDLLPPCNRACPAGESIQEWLAHAGAGRFEEAWRTIVRDNPFPALHGRVC